MNKEEIIKEYQKKKNKLRSYLYLKEDVRRINNNIKELIEEKEGYTGVSCIEITDMPRGGEPKLFDDVIIDYNDRIKILKNSRDRKLRRLSKIEESIENLEDYDYRRVLNFIYLDGYTIPQVAKKMFVNERTIKRKHKEGIQAINFEK